MFEQGLTKGWPFDRSICGDQSRTRLRTGPIGACPWLVPKHPEYCPLKESCAGGSRQVVEAAFPSERGPPSPPVGQRFAGVVICVANDAAASGLAAH
jgi:hypothetical protein